ncbi:beta-glycosidase [Prolixibacteraceae bacterium JC049]|nr:beta-glycosidase [Prolixibacteraceae bacterium JC049]
MRRLFIFLVMVSSMFSCNKKFLELTTTTEQNAWAKISSSEINQSSEISDVVINTDQKLQEIEGFGTCFNELGWTSLKLLKPEERVAILKEMFEPGTGANFTICRMPVAANDFAIDWYSYNETDGDFQMKNFSIENDKATLIPFIKQALIHNPELKVWASPWSPPSWMKYNKHYAAKSSTGRINNGLTPDKQGKEGTNMFIQEDKYFRSYALYFSKFIDAYKKQGIDIFMVMPQNEFNSAQIFPSCTWTASGLATFVGKYLGPAMKEKNIEVMFGTMERPHEALVDTLLNDKNSGQYLSGVGFQWAGKKALPGIHKRYPKLRLYQTEQECGNGSNDWNSCKYSWSLMKHYLSNGVNAYMYWNTSLKEGGISTWGWRQNSLVSVDTLKHTFQYNHEYYLMKHVSHYVQPGAYRLNTTGKFNNLLAFINPDKSIVVVIHNEEKTAKQLVIEIQGKSYSLPLKADSFSTFKLQK